MRITKAEAVQRIKNSGGSIFTVVFKKRTTGEMRIMNCRTDVSQYVKGTGKPVSAEARIIKVYDLKNKGYRSIPEEGLTQLKMGGQVYDVV